jgi:DNA-binding transcriptional LysR family regulator
LGSRSPLRARPALAQLEIFLKVVETRSFVGAAKLLGMSQPAVSQAIARLEEIYPGDLFVRRRGAPLTLTPVGEALFPLAQAMLHTADQSFLRTAAASQSQSGRLSVGFYPGIANGPLRDGLLAFRAQCPDVDLNLLEAVPSELHRGLRDGSLDLVVTAFMPDLASPAFAQETLWTEKLVAILPEGHPLAAREYLRWSDVAKLQVLLSERANDMSEYREITARAGVPLLGCAHYSVSRWTLLHLITMGFGITISFSPGLLSTAGVVEIPIEDKKAVVPIEGIWHAGDANPIRHRFVRIVRDVAVVPTDTQ